MAVWLPPMKTEKLAEGRPIEDKLFCPVCNGSGERIDKNTKLPRKCVMCIDGYVDNWRIKNRLRKLSGEN